MLEQRNALSLAVGQGPVSETMRPRRHPRLRQRGRAGRQLIETNKVEGNEEVRGEVEERKVKKREEQV